jgi:5-methylcytosine-specific restriction endonuclease McrA
MPKYKDDICSEHGLCSFVLEGRGYWRCKACRSKNVANSRRRTKEKLVNLFGGCCQICKYDRYVGALEFHHINPETKLFGLSKSGLNRNFKTLLAEASKCMLLCSNCHKELEAGIIKDLGENK